MDDIQLAQVAAAEDAVVQRLREKGLLPPDPIAEPDCKCVCHAPYFSRAVCPHCNGNNEVVRRQREKQRQHLESAFVTTYKSEPFIDVTRGGFWCRCSLGFTLESDLIAHLTAHGESPRENLRQSLQVALATAFVSMQATYNPGERQGLWLECLRLAKEIERLNN